MVDCKAINNNKQLMKSGSKNSIPFLIPVDSAEQSIYLRPGIEN
jgi:hypothetical protein